MSVLPPICAIGLHLYTIYCKIWNNLETLEYRIKNGAD